MWSQAGQPNGEGITQIIKNGSPDKITAMGLLHFHQLEDQKHAVSKLLGILAVREHSSKKSLAQLLGSGTHFTPE